MSLHTVISESLALNVILSILPCFQPWTSDSAFGFIGTFVPPGGEVLGNAINIEMWMAKPDIGTYPFFGIDTPSFNTAGHFKFEAVLFGELMARFCE
jgi:hypothetical protein